MRSLLVLIILPVVTFAQQNNGNWLTPFATVDFSEKQIVFRVAETSPVCELIPVVLLPGEFVLSREPSIHLKSAEIYQGIRQLGAYLENPDQPGGNYNDQLRYVRAFALQSFLALSGQGMPSIAVYDKVSTMAASPDQEVARISGMALELYMHVGNYLKEQYGRVDYLSPAIIPEPELDLFSPDRLISTHAKKTQKQITDSIVWPKYYSKEANSSDASEDIIESYDKGFVIAGNFEINNQQWSWLIKTDINGNILWEKILEGGDYWAGTTAIEPTMDGGMLSCGYIYSDAGKYEPYVMKLNSCGEKEWCKVFTSSVKDNPWAQDIIETSEGNIMILVNQWGTDNIEDLYLFKMSFNGDIIWKKPVCSGYVHPESAVALGWSLIETSEKKYLITGDVYWANPWNPGGSWPLRPLFALVDSAGNEKWVLPFGLNDTIIGHAHHSLQIGENEFIGVGRSVGQVVNREGIIMKFDTLGNELEFKKYNFSSLEPDFKVGLFYDILKRDSVYVIASVFGDDPNGPAPPGEIIVDSNQFFTNFSVLDYTHYNANDDPYTIILTEDQKLMSNSEIESNEQEDIFLTKLNNNLEPDTAYSGNYIYDSLCTTPGLPQSGFIYLDECDIITGEEIPSPEEYYSAIATIPITAYPNPTETEITLAFENTEHHTNLLLECYNIYGQKVHSERIFKGQQQTKLDLNGYAKGLYFALVKSNGKVAGTGRFVRK